MNDVKNTNEILVFIFERFYMFLGRLKEYTKIQLTPESITLLGKIMADLILVLAHSTKVITGSKISDLIQLLCNYWLTVH